MRKSFLLEALGLEFPPGWDPAEAVYLKSDGRILAELSVQGDQGLSYVHKGPEMGWDGLTWFGAGHNVADARAFLTKYVFNGDPGPWPPMTLELIPRC